MTNVLTRRRNNPGASDAQRRKTSDICVQVCGKKPDWNLLTDRDAADLVALASKTYDQLRPGMVDLRPLSASERKRFERLVGKSIGNASHFDDHRRDVKAQKELRRMAAEAAREPFKKKASKGLIAAIADDVDKGFMDMEDVAVLVTLAIAQHTGKAFAPLSTFDEGALFINPRYGFFGHELDPNGRFPGWKTSLKHLESNGWLTVTHNGDIWRVAPGDEWLTATGGEL